MHSVKLPTAALLLFVSPATVQPQASGPVSAATMEAPHVFDWEKSAGGKQEFEVASIHLTKPGEFTAPNFPISNDDSYTAGPNDSFVADFSLVTYIQFAYKLRLSSDQMKVMLEDAPQWVSDQNFDVHAKASAPSPRINCD